MEKKIVALKNAYAKNDRVALVKAAKSLVAYSKKHPFALVINPVECAAIVNLANKIIAA